MFMNNETEGNELIEVVRSQVVDLLKDVEPKTDWMLRTMLYGTGAFSLGLIPLTIAVLRRKDPSFMSIAEATCERRLALGNGTLVSFGNQPPEQAKVLSIIPNDDLSADYLSFKRGEAVICRTHYIGRGGVVERRLRRPTLKDAEFYQSVLTQKGK